MVCSLNKYYLGLDLSTQQLKCTVIDDTHSIVFEDAVNFGRDLPEYDTDNGAISHGNDIVTSPTLMWVQAMDMLLERLAKTPYISHIVAISGAGQQHGSEYWSAEGTKQLARLDSTKSLKEQLNGAFSIEQSPIWQDSSTTKQCRELEDCVGGPENLAYLTGSKAYERFTGSQIAKIYQTKREQYNNTEWITLVSSFMATLFLGKLAPMDAAEASGTNLMDIRKRQWVDLLLEKSGGPTLKAKLGLQPVSNIRPLGRINSYYVQRYGFNSDCQIMPFTGDNSATLVSMNLLHGDCVISLGTSDTVLVSLKEAEPTTESHLMAHPTDTTAFMGMLCYKNGSLTRQHFRDLYANGDWETFNQLLTAAPPTSRYNGFYYWMQEIIPFAKGIFRFDGAELLQGDFHIDDEIERGAVNIRCLVESQFLSMRVRLERMMGGIQRHSLKRILATGGAAANYTLLQVLANVFGTPVYTQKEGVNSASLGGALLAKYGTLLDVTFDDMIKQHETGEEVLQLICMPDIASTSQYTERLEEYCRLENIVLQHQQE